MKQLKREFAILRNGVYMGKTWAVSEDKAKTNYWWKNDKLGKYSTSTAMRPSDYEAVLV